MKINFKIKKFNKKQGKKLKIPKLKSPKGVKFISNFLSVILVFLVIATIYSAFAEEEKPTQKISISELAQNINQEKVKEITIEGNNVKILFVDGTNKETKKESEIALTQTLVNYGVDLKALNSLKIEVKNESGLWYWILNLSPFIFPILFILFFVWMLSRQVKGAGAQAFNFGQSRARITDPKDTKQRITFDDVAGAKEAKEELREIVDFLKNPKKFLDIGAQIPKGVLLMGAPGTGKTLLARAVAGEAQVPFFSISGSEFVEMFVGVGASRVRDLFKMAKQAAPAIIFVDEIDAVGRVRGTGVGGGNDEREQTLNQILVEMDGFEQNEKVIIMAASNRPDVLDPALLRPGRFDRRVVIDLPDRNDREAILGIHIRKKQLAEDINMRIIAERTPGFSGADIYSLVNEAAILAAREDRKKIAQFDFVRSIEKVILGPERKSHLLIKKEKKITAYHEAGHALIASVLEYADPVHKISIISRGHAAGYTLHLPIEEKRLRSKKDFLDDLAVSLGGYVTEKLIFDDITTGSSNDLQIATAKARDMVTKYGMSDKLGSVAFEEDIGVVIRGGIAKVEKEYSEKINAEIDSEVMRIMKEAHDKAERTIKTHMKLLEQIAQKLIEEETIERDEFEKLLIANGITPKKKEE
ncbi:ATP-dependent zinc metalloprotease FtsH [Patescibacteria group bacterium]|nr:ATP-dependent zinc metalloprotease FtsH [Patescibacteria group bacterium]MBU4057706.1 ATP-dependent zinc metalloprotease FtsH [Patescibacteria group bacterium]MBU4115605.1 ATP-dependent zinc metalloprotease FtsH [Patescibacteria group bacterium]